MLRDLTLDGLVAHVTMRADRPAVLDEDLRRLGDAADPALRGRGRYVCRGTRRRGRARVRLREDERLGVLAALPRVTRLCTEDDAAAVLGRGAGDLLAPDRVAHRRFWSLGGLRPGLFRDRALLAFLTRGCATPRPFFPRNALWRALGGRRSCGQRLDDIRGPPLHVLARRRCRVRQTRCASQRAYTSRRAARGTRANARTSEVRDTATRWRDQAHACARRRRGARRRAAPRRRHGLERARPRRALRRLLAPKALTRRAAFCGRTEDCGGAFGSVRARGVALAGTAAG